MKTTMAMTLAAAMAAFAAGAATVKVDFAKTTGAVKPLHGVNNAPMRVGENPQWEFAEAGIPYMRTHDSAGMWGGTHYVDIPNIFPDFDADENDPKSYDFVFTDAWLTNIVAAGTEVFYRLGVTIENYHRIKSYNIYPPKDFAKWARICEHIVRHYNEGWADGYRWNIKYWEIWGEPENPPLWKGTREQYFELYRISANHLKRCFPEIRVGGYGGCGFYAIDPRDDIESSDFRKSFVTWFEEFLKFVTDPKTKAPLDFFSWHLYVKETPERIARHAAYVRRMLDAAGLAKTENIFDEWNRIGKSWTAYDEMKSEVGAACVAEAFCLMQRSSIDKAMYYDALPTRVYCGILNFGDKKESRTTTYHAFRYWNGLYRLGTAVESAADAPHLDVAAAKGANGGKAVLLVNDTPEPRTVELALKGADGAKFSLYLLDDDHDGFAGTPCDVSKPLALAPFMTALLTTEPMPVTASRAPVRKVFAGQDDGRASKDIYLLVGQSNMAGRGKLSEGAPIPNERIEKLDKSDKWVAATEPLHFDKPVAGAGLGMSFARIVADRDRSVTVGLVPCAVGGSALDEWMPGAHLYVEAMRRAKIAQKDGEIKAILWHQGESDADRGKREASYNARLAKMVAAMREELGLDAKKVPFIFGSIGEFAQSPYYDDYSSLNKVMRRATDLIPNSAWVEAGDLTSNSDRIHFDTRSVRTLGQRYAAAYLRLVK